MSYFCAGCGWHPCRCDGWRKLERERRNKHPVTWHCDHLSGNRDKTYNGIGLRLNGAKKSVAPLPILTEGGT